MASTVSRVVAVAQQVASPRSGPRGNLGAHLSLGDALDHYAAWPQPTTIIADGPYGVAGFPGDPPVADALGEWYQPHVAAWSKHALPSATLWFWNSEVGWAEVHPVLKAHGWRYAGAHVWDKGIAHIAGNVNGKSIRGFPVVSEICVRYVRDVTMPTLEGELLPLNQWLRYEWARAGLPLYVTNEAAGVRNAATRKWFTLDHLWYHPPAEAMLTLARYAKKHGRRTRVPYFSLDRRTMLKPAQWELMRSKWNHTHGITNVWREPALRGEERIRHNGRMKCVHLNQKPLKLIERTIRATTDKGDVVWEPFGGLCSGVVAANRLGCPAYAAEINPDYYELALDRLDRENAVNGNN